MNETKHTNNSNYNAQGDIKAFPAGLLLSTTHNDERV